MYKFPHITCLDQVRDAIEGRDEFFVAERDWGYVVNYMVNLIDSFPTPDTKDPKLNEKYKIRRDCRGIKFDLDGNIIARPYSKFFNLGERSETFPEAIDWDQKFIILDKLDGSMVHPILVADTVVLCTKMGITDVVAPAQDFAEKKGHKAIFYMDFCYDLMKSGMTPIFEWCSRKQRIVVDYPNDMLVLTAVRKMVSGEYKLYDQMEALAAPYRVPLVNRWLGTFDGINEFVEKAQFLEDEEGYVFRFDSGEMFKSKNVWYVQLHKTKELLAFEKDVWALILDARHDDAKAFMEQEDKDRIDAFAEDLHTAIDVTVDRLKWIVIAAKDNLNNSKKRFAIEIVNDHEPRVERGLLFKIWDDEDPRDVVCSHIRDHLGSGPKLEEVRCLANGILWGAY